MPNSYRGRAWLLLAAALVLQIALHRSAIALKHDLPKSHAHELFKRVADSDSGHTSLLSLPYDKYYFAAPVAARPFILAGLLVILSFLFSFIGISASDFFCPNLSTIATYLGLSESTAGVTFLAFGNGSPDVFSTFAALKNNTFGLAIGELIGAATFIVSVVVGSIALIRPFHVPRHAFIRDVTFFTLAVVVLITVLQDGSLTAIEASSMVALYMAYVAVVVGGNWWSRRRARRHGTPRSKHMDSGASHEEGANRPPTLSLPSPQVDSRPTLPQRASSITSGPRSLSPIQSESRSRSSSFSEASIPIPHHDHPIDTPRANFSLLGAIEFRDVVNSLRRSSQMRSTQASSKGTPDVESTGDYFGPISAYTHRRSVSAHLVRSPGAENSSGYHDSPGSRQRAASIHPHVQQSYAVKSMSTPLHASTHTSTPSHGNESSPKHVAPPAPAEPNPWEFQPGNPPTPFPPSAARSPPKPELPRLVIPASARARQPTGEVPVISVTDPFGTSGEPSTHSVPSSSANGTPAKRESRFRIRRRTRMALRVLFPSLQNFRHKSVLGMVLAVVCVPAVLALTITLPVVDDGQGNEGAIALPEGQEEPLNEEGAQEDDESVSEEEEEDRHLTPLIGEELHHLVDHGFSPLHSPLGRISHSALRRVSMVQSPDDVEDDDPGAEALSELIEDMEEEEALDFHPALAATQCVLGPMFCTMIIFRGTDYFWWIILGTGVAGALAAGVVLRFATDGMGQPWRLVRCFAGFVVSMVWIAAIADEVVSVLGALGEILGLSDALIGLTIFAVGNSLADLVANVTVAQFAPAMAYAACFGGPMLNLLLGVGGSGTYSILSQAHHPSVKVHFSPTLWVSASGLVLMLLATAIVVPLNGYRVDRRWAGVLIAAYCILMAVNVAVELALGRDDG